ncbi:hypothetical protein ACQY0O_000916 [Thecaphora frezii]
MFAPPVPPSGSRPTSAAGHHPSYAHQPYDLPRSPMKYDPPSPLGQPPYAWRPDSGLPPPPSQIDAWGDDLRYSRPAEHHHHDRPRSRSPAMRTPSRYGLEFGGSDESRHVDAAHMPMNTVTKHPKLKLEVVLSSTIFEAGGTISGRLELTCTSQKVRLGEIAIELEGVEELSSRDHAATQLFLYNRTLFQGEHLPPSNAVLPAAAHNGYRTARKGRTTFPFRFRLPSTAPSCVTFSGNAALRYQLKATAQTWWNDERTIVTYRREAFVVEKWSDELDEKYRRPVEAIGDTRLFMGGHGAVWLEAGVIEQLFWGGGQVLIRCGIKNNTKRQVAGIKVALARRLVFPVGSAEGTHDAPDKVSLEPRITEIVHEQNFKGSEYEFPPNEEAVCNVAVDIPRDLRTIRKTRLFEIRVFALVSLVFGSFAKDLTVEIPIYVAHTASVQTPAQEHLDSLHPSPADGRQRMPDRPHSAAGYSHHHGQPHHGLHPQPGQLYGLTNMDPQMLALQQMAVDRGWSPAPQLPSAGSFSQMPSRPASTAPGMIQLPSSPQPFSVSSTVPGQLEWNPAATGWNHSQLMQMANMSASIPRSASAAPNLGYAPRSPSAAPNLAQLQTFAPLQQQQVWQPPQRSFSVSPGPTSPSMPDAAHSVSMPSHGGMPAVGSTHLLNDPQRRGSTASLGNSGAGHVTSPVAPPPQPMQPLVQGSRLHASEPVLNPPPAQYVSQPATPPQPYYAPDASASSFSGPGPGPLAGLATIDEDGESQAGTIKSVAALGTLNKPQDSPNSSQSVSRNDIEQFEAMAKAEEDEEEVKRRMRELGMVPDESAFESVRQAGHGAVNQRIDRMETPTQDSAAALRAREREAQSLPKPPVSSGKSQVASGSARPRASDIFVVAQKAREAGEDATEAVAALTGIAPEPSSTPKPVASSQPSSGVGAWAEQEASSSAITIRPDAGTSSSVRRPSQSQGRGLDALETKLVRSTTPKILASPSKAIVTLANLGQDSERSSSPLTSPSKHGSARSRKESALRAAAAAREAALAEKKRREQEQSKLRREQEERRKAEEARRRAEAEQTRIEEERCAAERAKAAEVERIQREEERRAEEAAIQRDREKRERELKQKEEEARRRQREREEEEAKEKAEAEVRRRQREQEEGRRTAYKEAELAAAKEREAQKAERACEKARGAAQASRALESAKPAQNSCQASDRPLSESVSPAQTQTERLQHSDLKKEAVGRVAGWLSNSNATANAHPEMPSTPSGSVISLLKKDEGSKTAFPIRSASQVRNPLYHSPPSGRGQAAIPKSHTTANVASPTTREDAAPRERSRTYFHIEEPLPTLSPDLRALVDSSDIRPARRAGTALRDHPISRKISTSSQADANYENRPVPTASLPASLRRDRHTSLPSWPKPGLPSFGSGIRPIPGIATLDQSAPTAPAVERSAAAPRRSADIFSSEDREVVIPSGVEKTLNLPDGTAATPSTAGGYDVRSARGGRGGRVTSVAQLWSNIAGDTVPEADSLHEGPSPPPPSGTFKPKARRTSAIGGAPALDFSKVKAAVSSGGAVTSIAASFASRTSASSGSGAAASRPESFKGGSAPQFLNNASVARAVFAGAPTSTSASAASSSLSSSATTALSISTTATARSGERRPLPQPETGGQRPAPRLVRPIAQSPSTAMSSGTTSSYPFPSTVITTPASTEAASALASGPRRISTHLLSTFDQSRNGGKAEAEAKSGRNREEAEAREQTLPNGVQIKMGGRGTTKPIGQGKLRDLKAVWGS